MNSITERLEKLYTVNSGYYDTCQYFGRNIRSLALDALSKVEVSQTRNNLQKASFQKMHKEADVEKIGLFALGIDSSDNIDIIQRKLIDEDRTALKDLQDPVLKENTKEIASQFALYLERALKTDKLQNKYMENLIAHLGGLRIQEEYPILKKSPKTFIGMIRFLREEKNHSFLLAILWVAGLLRSLEKIADSRVLTLLSSIREDYDLIIKKNRDHKIFREATPAEGSRFGNSKTIRCELFQEYFPYKRDVDYRQVNENTTIPWIRETFLNNKEPYISGASGMANASCAVLAHLNISLSSKEGAMYRKAISAFIVGSGMHSYHEVDFSFDLYAKCEKKAIEESL